MGVRTREPARAPSRRVLGNREFRAIFASYALSILGDQVARIAVSLLVFDRSGSALAATATFAVSFVPSVVGGPFLTVLSDRLPRRTVMVVCDVVRAALVLLLALPAVPLPLAFALLLLVGLLEPPFQSSRGAVLPDVLSGEDYPVGSGLLQIVGQAGQVLGYLAGGGLVALTSIRGALALDAATFAVSAGVLLAGLRSRPGAIAGAERRSLIAETREGARFVLGNARLRRLLGLALLGAVVMIVPEGLAVPVAASLGGGPAVAGVLTAAVPAGFVLGSVLLLRLPLERRGRLLGPLLPVSCLPLLLTPLTSSVPLVTGLWVLAGAAAALQIVANAGYIAATPPELRGRAFGVALTSLYAVQGLAVLLGGAVADLLDDPRLTVAVLAAAVLLVGLPLGLRPAAAQDQDGLVR